MDQLKQVGQFVWKWRFWFVMGISVIIAGVIQPLGTEKVKAMVLRRKSELDAAYNQVTPFTRGEHPNADWQTAIKTLETKAQEEIGTVQKDLFLEQAKRFVWPEAVSAIFSGRPFNTPLDDEGARYLFTYSQAFPDQIKQLMLVADPITVLPDGSVTGNVVLNDSAIERPKFDDTPNSQPAWLAQEQIWIQRAVLEVIQKINAPSKDWYSAPIKQVVAIRLGAGAVDVRKLAERAGDVPLLPLSPMVGEAATSAVTATPAPGAGGQEATGNVATRYLEITPEGRTVPISIALLVDQRRIPEVIAGIETIDFGYVLREVSWSVPSTRINPPTELEEFLNVAPGVSKEAIDNTVQLVTFGEMFIRDMPPAMRQEWEQKKQQALNPQAAPAAPGTPPADPNAAPPADPSAPPTADPNAPPTAEPNTPPTADPNAPPTAEPPAPGNGPSDPAAPAGPPAPPTTSPM
jgi:hypothetical protein